MSFGGASYLYLAAAIVSEVIGTSALKASNEFTRPVPTMIMLAAFLSAFYFLTLTLRTIPVGVAYAIWSGVGIVMISIIAARCAGHSGHGADRGGRAGDQPVLKIDGALKKSVILGRSAAQSPESPAGRNARASSA